MKEARYNTMFRDIESQNSGRHGHRVPLIGLTVVCSIRCLTDLTLMALYKLMKTGVIDTLDFQLLEEKKPTCFMEQTSQENRSR